VTALVLFRKILKVVIQKTARFTNRIKYAKERIQNIQGGSDKSGKFKILLVNHTAQLKIIPFH
jgi:hypothetical protein